MNHLPLEPRAAGLRKVVTGLFTGAVGSSLLSRYLPAAGALCLCAGTLLFAQTERGDYTQRNLGSLAQPAPLRAQTDNAKYSIGSYPLYWPEFPEGEGRNLVTAYCNACHSPRYILMQPPLSREQWTAEVNKMVKTYGADIPEGDQTTILNYLVAHYTLETRKR
jgi:hypothetical protein